MKKLTSLILIAFSSNIALAECNFSTGVTKLEDGNYKYTKECHIKVGELKQDNEIKDVQLIEYKKAIELKDLALRKTEERADLWMDTSFKMEDRLNKVDELRSKNNTLYYALGIGTAILAVWAAGQLR